MLLMTAGPKLVSVYKVGESNGVVAISNLQKLLQFNVCDHFILYTLFEPSSIYSRILNLRVNAFDCF